MYTTKIVSPCEWMNSSKASKIMRQFSVRNIQFVGWFLLKIITVYKTFKSRWFFFTLRMSLSVLKRCDIQVLQYPWLHFFIFAFLMKDQEIKAHQTPQIYKVFFIFVFGNNKKFKKLCQFNNLWMIQSRFCLIYNIYVSKNYLYRFFFRHLQYSFSDSTIIPLTSLYYYFLYLILFTLI